VKVKVVVVSLESVYSKFKSMIHETVPMWLTGCCNAGRCFCQRWKSDDICAPTAEWDVDNAWEKVHVARQAEFCQGPVSSQNIVLTSSVKYCCVEMVGTDFTQAENYHAISH